MQIRQFLSLTLVALTAFLGACGSLSSKTPVQGHMPAVATASTTERQLVSVLRRIEGLELYERRRRLAENEAKSVAAIVVAQPSFTGISGCFEVPRQLSQSEFYEEHAPVMDAQYAVACLYGAKKLEDQKAKVKAKTPAPVPSKPSTKK